MLSVHVCQILRHLLSGFVLRSEKAGSVMASLSQKIISTTSKNSSDKIFQSEDSFDSLALMAPTFLKLAALTLILTFALNSLALPTATLPTGIYSPSFRYGEINGIDQRYTENGSLVRLTDYKSIDFDAKTLAKFNTQAQSLISTLNRFGAFNLGDSFNLGTLEIQSKPEIKYFAPVLAYGIKSNWTLGFGLPVIHYKNDVHLAQSFSNIGYYRSQFSGLSSDLDHALNTNIGEATQQALLNKGYSRLENRDQQFLGDAQLVSVFKIFEDTDQSVIHQATLNLPTGPKYNPDDLLALNNFHKTSLENTIGYSRHLGKYFKVIPYSSLKLFLPEKIDARVPKSSDDILPDQDSKETVQRMEGASLEVGVQTGVDLYDAFQISFDYKAGAKAQDRYSASGGNNYELLSQNSSSRWQKVSAEFVYSTVKSYFQKKSLLPMMLTLSFFDTISGINIERKSGQELATTFFF